jgi:biopolymer transport protein ExbB
MFAFNAEPIMGRILLGILVTVSLYGNEIQNPTEDSLIAMEESDLENFLNQETPPSAELSFKEVEIPDASFEELELKNETTLVEETSSPQMPFIPSQTPVIAETPLKNVELAETPLDEKSPLISSPEESLLAKNKEVSTLKRKNRQILKKEPATLKIDIQKVLKGAPIIYSLLFAISLGSVTIGFYNFSRLRREVPISKNLISQIKNDLMTNQYDRALALCSQTPSLLCQMISAGLSHRKQDLPTLMESMKSEGKRASVEFWQRLAILNDIALIAPLLGLLGTVFGMFYAFYDLNRSLESFTLLFDGLGISVGTTIAGIMVSLIALMLHSFGKYRLTRALVQIEREALSLVPLISSHPGSV